MYRVASHHHSRGSVMISHRSLASALRGLAIDAVERAASGHPGMPLGMADVATVLFREFLVFDPRHPAWPNRDRFVLSAGHGSMLLYGLLYLTGYEDITISQLQSFRQLGSLTPGHPEYGHTPGVETTTGPLGQGFANAVGMALGERSLRAELGSLIHHKVYCIAGDGCLMEGISQEALSFAGHQKLSHLIVLFDDNGITIDGPTTLSTSDDHMARFRASGWATHQIDGHDETAIRQALTTAQTADRPTLIACRTQIGYGSPTKAGSEKVHGSPLGADEAARAKEMLGCLPIPFDIKPEILDAWRKSGCRHASTYEAWAHHFAQAPTAIKERLLSLAPSLQPVYNRLSSQIPGPESTRKASEIVLKELVPHVPALIGGSADLTPSNNTLVNDMPPLTADSPQGRYIHYGIREHAMGAIMNGLALEGGFIPYGGTFLTFADYMRPAIRLSALMRLKVIYVMTHDSIGLGEDGPTHQPIEHLMSLRLIPHLTVMRPADLVETYECWALALQGQTSLLALSRQTLPALNKWRPENLSAKGGYVLQDGPPGTITLIGTGSEVGLAVEVASSLKIQGYEARVVSMPIPTLFQKQSETYRHTVLGSGLKVVIEAGIPQGWESYVGTDTLIIGLNDFGASAPAPDLFTHFGLTAPSITERILSSLQQKDPT